MKKSSPIASNLVLLEKRLVQPGLPDYIAWLSLNRPEAANALNAEMIETFMLHVKTLSKIGLECRALILRAEGKHFSAGADLGYMKDSVKLSPARNREQTRRFSDLFEALFRLPMPTVALAHGSVFGGALGMLACCDYVLADENTKFCLSEIKWGLIPAMIFPYLNAKMNPGRLNRFVLTAAPFTAQEALDAGLVERIAKPGELPRACDEELQRLLEGEPAAQRAFKQHRLKIRCSPEPAWKKHRAMMAALIARTRAGAPAQDGLAAFLNQGTPTWKLNWPPK